MCIIAYFACENKITCRIQDYLAMQRSDWPTSLVLLPVRETSIDVDVKDK